MSHDKSSTPLEPRRRAKVNLGRGLSRIGAMTVRKLPKTNHTLTFQKVGSDAVSTNLEDFVQRIHKTSQLPQWWMMQGTSLQLGHSNGIPELSHLKV